MSKILLIGRGPLPSVDAPQLSFSQHRTAAFHSALRDAGHTVRLVLLVPDAKPSPLTEWAGSVEITEEGPGWIQAARSASEGAEIVVSAGPYNPGRIGAAIAEDRPFWADIPGDPIAELSALSRVTPGGLSTAATTTAYTGAIAVLGRADALSVISTAQRHATLGQLGMLSRTLHANASPPVSILPISADFGLDAAPPRAPLPDSPLILALNGVFNPWFDDEALATILGEVLSRRSDIHVVCTGGGIPGFYTDGYARFQSFAADFPDRITLHGWLPHSEMAAVLQGAHAGISIDRPGPEPELGSRTRLLLFAHLGLMPISTVRCDLARSWQAAGALHPLPFQDIDGAIETLIDLEIDTRVTAKAQAFSQEHFSIANVTIPLLEWCADPVRTAPAAVPEALIAAELDASRDQLKQIYASPTWTALNRLHTLGAATMSRIKFRPE